jgi:hypothetical protein
MDEDILVPLIQMVVALIVCVGPILLLVVGIVIAAVFLRRRKPKEVPQAEPSPAPVTTPPAEPTWEPAPSTPPEPQPAAGPSLPVEPAVRNCSSCGAENPVDNTFCEYCGERLE